MTPRPASVTPSPRGSRLAFVGLAPLALALVAGSVGCYRATGETRPTTVAQQIPATGGDRVGGNKATAGPGDYYLGNDYIQMAVDGAKYGSAKGQFGAPSGGAILDIGGVALDTAYNRVSMPTDNVESLAPVVNQDPDLRLVFDRYSATNTTDLVTLTMQGYLLDPLHKLAGATWASDGRVQGVTAVHAISLGSHDTFFTLSTTVTNNSGAAINIQSLGDYLHQRGGGFRFVIPANQDASGAPLSTWGLDIPGSDFTQPMATSVMTSMVALEGAEPSADDLDSHQSLGLLSLEQNQVNQDQVLVASDPQNVLSQARPAFPARLVVGSIATGLVLADQGGTLSYSRRLYAVSGQSLSSAYPVGSESISNLMESARGALRGLQLGIVSFTLDPDGTSAFKGYRQTEIRFERYVGSAADPTTDPAPASWRLERLAIPEASENPAPNLLESINLPANPGSPSGAYRMVLKSKDSQSVILAFSTVDSLGNLLQSQSLLYPNPATVQNIPSPFSAEMSLNRSSSGSILSPFVIRQFFSLRAIGQIDVVPAYQPARFAFQALDSSGLPDASLDPDSRRNRYMAGFFNPILKTKAISGLTPGNYEFSGGDGFFGASFLPGFYAASFMFRPGDYNGFASQGPLNPLSAQKFSASNLTQNITLPFISRTLPRPSGWSSFDMPGPSQRTTGGMLPAEQLSSALAEGVNVVGRTEDDEFTDGGALYTSFRSEFSTSGVAATDAARLGVIGNDPMVVNARSSSLAEGTFTSLFSPTPDHSLPFGGALFSEGWTAADFIGQGGGSFVIANRPRGPQGLFTAHPVAAGVPLGTGANSWWGDTDALANGRRTGDFDAIELLRAEGCNPADPSAWFAEFKNVRADWFNLLNLETPTQFTKGLGLSSGVYSLDTPVGLSRTYIKTGPGLAQADLSPVANALKSGAAVASTGPLLDVSIGTQGPGGFVTGTNATVAVTVNVWAATWVPIDEVRIIVNGQLVGTATPFGASPAANGWTADPADARHWTQTFNVSISTLTGGKDGWVVVEAGVPLATTGAYAVGTPWNKIMKGIYPVAVTNPIFVDVDGGGYTAPL